jgi:5'-3' exonuclease
MVGLHNAPSSRHATNGLAATTGNPPVILIDLSSIVHPLYHQSANEPDPNWTSVQAIARVRELASRSPFVGICADSGRSFRKDIDASYKANRPEKNEPLVHQLRMTEEKLAGDGLPILKAAGYEADDVIATACAKAVQLGHAVQIHSADKDLMQLVTDAAQVTVHSIRDGTAFDEIGVTTKFKVTPAQMRDYLTLVGDSADNIKGAPGIGPAKASDLLARFGSLDSVLAHVDDLTNGTKKALVESGLALKRARTLITLRADAPITIDAIFQDRTPKAEETMNETLVDDAQPETAPAPPQPMPEMDPEKQTQTLAVRPLPPLNAAEWDKELEPRNVESARTVAKWLHDSRLFSQYGSPQAVFAIILAGRELNLGTMASLRGFHIVEGKPTMAADLIRALVMASGKADYFMCKERTPTQSTWQTKRKGDPEPVLLTYTMEEAKTAKLVRDGSGWTKHPSDMVAKTASAKLCRLVYPDVTFGLYSPEELGGNE